MFAAVYSTENIYFYYNLNNEYNKILSHNRFHLIIAYSAPPDRSINLKILNNIYNFTTNYEQKHSIHFYLDGGMIYGFRGILNNRTVIVLVPTSSVLFTTSMFNLNSTCTAADCLIKLEPATINSSTNIIYSHGNLSLSPVYNNISVTIINNYSNNYTISLFSAVKALGASGDAYLYLGIHDNDFIENYFHSKNNSINLEIVLVAYIFDNEAQHKSLNPNTIEFFKNNLIRQLRSYNVNYVIVDFITTPLKSGLENSEFMIIYIEAILVVMTLFVLMYVSMLFDKVYIPRKKKIYRLLASFGYDTAILLRKLNIIIIVSLIFSLVLYATTYWLLPVLEPTFKQVYELQSILILSIIIIYIFNIIYKIKNRIYEKYYKYKIKIEYIFIIILLLQILIVKNIAATFIGKVIVEGYLYGILFSIFLFLIFKSKIVNNLIYKISKITGYQGIIILLSIIFFSIISPVIGSYALTLGKQELVTEYVPTSVCRQGIIFVPTASETLYNLTGYLDQMDLKEWYYVTNFLVKKVNNISFITYINSGNYVSNPSPGVNVAIKKASVKLPVIVVSDELMDRLGYRDYDWVLFVSPLSRYKDRILSAFNTTSNLTVWLDYSDIIAPPEQISFNINKINITYKGFPLWIFNDNPHEYPIIIYMARLDYSSNALVVRWSKFKELNIPKQYLVLGKLGILVKDPSTVNKILAKYPLLLRQSYYIDCALLKENILALLNVSLESLILPLAMFSGLILIIAAFLYKYELDSIIKSKVKLLISQGYDSWSLIKNEILSYIVGLLFVAAALILYVWEVLPRPILSGLNTYVLLIIVSLIVIAFTFLLYHLHNISKFIREYMGEAK